MAQFAAGSKELKEFAKNASMAQGEAEKLGILKETVAYISQMDKALSKLKKNQPDIFKQIFGSVDKDMKAAMQPLMQMPKEMGTLITKIGKQLDGIRSGKIEATNSEMKALGETFRGVAKALNMEVDLSFLDGTSKAKVKADKLTASMEQLAKAYYNVHKAEVSTGLSLTLPDEPKKKRTKKSSGKGTASSGETPTISNSRDIKTVETLTNSYTKLRKEVEKIKGGEDIYGIIKAFKIAEDELDDHFMTLKQWALLNGFTVPYKVKEYSKFAEKDTKRLDSLKNEQKASYYIKQAIESEQDAIASYEEALKNEDLPYELHAILMKNMFEETEHLEKLTLLQNAFDSKVLLVNWK